PSRGPPKRQRQERTVYTRSQQEELEAHFEESPYLTFDKRQELAQKLDLGEHQVQPGSSGSRSSPRAVQGGEAAEHALLQQSLKPLPPPLGILSSRRTGIPGCPLSRAPRESSQQQNPRPTASTRSGVVLSVAHRVASWLPRVQALARSQPHSVAQSQTQLRSQAGSRAPSQAQPSSQAQS
ncbi:hypothetical protein P7K49_034720, partial [Saguinus oedipus]